MTIKSYLTTLLSLIVVLSVPAMSDEQKKPAIMPKVADDHQEITLGAGCFWCVEAVFNRLDGVISSTSGYMGGTRKKPTYQDVIDPKRNTGEVEVVHVVYDPKIVSTEKILSWFWELHDPTQKDGQGGDIGPQYLSTVFYYNEAQKKATEASQKLEQLNLKKPIATRLIKAGTFYPAEVYHQDYYRLNKNKNPYCKLVIEPKMKKLQLENEPDKGK